MATSVQAADNLNDFSKDAIRRLRSVSFDVASVSTAAAWTQSSKVKAGMPQKESFDIASVSGLSTEGQTPISKLDNEASPARVSASLTQTISEPDLSSFEWIWQEFPVESWLKYGYINQPYFEELFSETTNFVKATANDCGLVGDVADLIEIGSGTGELIRACRGHFNKCIGVDVNSEFIAHCKQQAADGPPNEHYIFGDAWDMVSLLRHELPQRSEQQPCVVACVGNTMNVIPEELHTRIYEQIATLTGKDGVAIFTYFNAAWFDDAVVNFYKKSPELCGVFTSSGVDLESHTLTTSTGYYTRWTSLEEVTRSLMMHGFEVFSQKLTCKGILVAARRLAISPLPEFMQIQGTKAPTCDTSKGKAPSVQLSRVQVLQLASELLNGFSAESFQEKLKSIIQSEGNMKHSPARIELALTVQQRILPRYGFPGDSVGVIAMLRAIAPFLGDWFVRKLVCDIDVKLGIAENTTINACNAFIATPKALDKKKAFDIAQELFEKFSEESFQEELQKCQTALCKSSRIQLIRAVQGKILPKYGFSGNDVGVVTMLDCMAPFLNDPEFATVMAAIDKKIGLPPNMTARDIVAAKQRKDEHKVNEDMMVYPTIA